mgnify:CR=1 FL=1|jgi:hypothetical protein
MNKTIPTGLIQVWMVTTNGLIATGVWLSWLL